MENVVQFPEGYRYNSDMELFQIAVDCAKEMLESNKMILLYHCIDVISAEVFMTPVEFEQEYDRIRWNDFIDILDNEIVYLLRQGFEGSSEDETGLKRYLTEKNVSEKQQEKIIQLKSDKCQYASKRLAGEKEKKRYNLKKSSVWKKLSDIECELSRTIDEEEIVYATIKMSVNSTLEVKEMPKVTRDIFDQDNVTFICDRSDIEYLIRKLERIKQML